MNDKYDIIIVGSGLGGLVCGYILSKNGYKVIVLEKNRQIGGCLQMFGRDGVKFDTGMHYIGSLDEGQTLHRLFKYFNVFNDVKFSRLNNDGYDVFSFRGEQYKFANGYDNFIETLAQKFPNERRGLENYIAEFKDITSSSPLYNLRETDGLTLINPNYFKKSVNELIESVTSDPKLQNVLIGNLPLYAGIKDKTPIFVHVFLQNFFMQSAYRIVGGSANLAQSLADSITRFGGKVVAKSEVSRFICNDNKMTSVELTSGEIIEGDYFISDIHPEAALDKIDSRLIRKAFRNRIKELENSISNFTVYLKFKKGTVPYMNYNFYYHDDYNVWEKINYDPSQPASSYLYMHQCTEENGKYAESAKIITYMRYEEVKKWENTTVGRRGADYLEFKKLKAEQLLLQLEKSFPGIGSRIESYYTSSPLTYRDYTATKEGSMYGIVRNKDYVQQSIMTQRTKIPNFYMTGQNINSHGIMGVTIGSIITCGEFLGVNNIIRQIQNCYNG